MLLLRGLLLLLVGVSFVAADNVHPVNELFQSFGRFMTETKNNLCSVCRATCLGNDNDLGSQSEVSRGDPNLEELKKFAQERLVRRLDAPLFHRLAKRRNRKSIRRLSIRRRELFHLRIV